jgi:hypothetical protein
MAQFDNPYADDPGRARPIPGVVEQQWASLIEMPLRFLGVHLYQHEKDGLASFMGAFLRAYPNLKNKFQPVNNVENDKI